MVGRLRSSLPLMGEGGVGVTHARRDWRPAGRFPTFEIGLIEKGVCGD